MTSPIVSAQWLKENINTSSLILLDTSKNKSTECIPGAKCFDIPNDFSDTSSEFPNTIPTTNQFQEKARNLGVNSDSHVILYDNNGIFNSPRAWWLFRIMGHLKVSVLDGGLPAWKNKEYKTTSILKRKTQASGNFTYTLNPKLLKSFEDIQVHSTQNLFTLIDARSEGRFSGKEPEIRKGIQSGNIPYSFNIHYKEVLENKKFKSKEELQEIFKPFILKKNPIVFTCGSGITACILLLACSIAFPNEYSIYDGSWTQWAIKNNLRLTI